MLQKKGAGAVELEYFLTVV